MMMMILVIIIIIIIIMVFTKSIFMHQKLTSSPIRALQFLS